VGVILNIEGAACHVGLPVGRLPLPSMQALISMRKNKIRNEVGV